MHRQSDHANRIPDRGTLRNHIGHAPGSQFYVSFSPDLFAKSFSYIKATGVCRRPGVWARRGQAQRSCLGLPSGRIHKRPHPTQASSRGYSRSAGCERCAEQNPLRQRWLRSLGQPHRNSQLSVGWQFMALQPTWLGLLMNNAATGEGGDCYGDSGGPKFIDGDRTTIYATVTTGDMNCRATTWDWRLDTPEARAFLGRYIPLP